MKEPAYLKLYQRIRAGITGGLWPFGSRLPSRRVAALENGLSVTTVMHAYEILASEGYIEPKGKSGYYVIYRERELAAMPQASAQFIPYQAPVAEQGLQSGETLPWTQYARAMRKVLSLYGPRLMEKTANIGCAEFRMAVAAYLAAERGIHVSPEQIIIGSGAEYLYGLILQMLGEERVFALEDPSYAMIRQVYEAHGVRCEMLPMDRHGIREEALAASEASVLHVTPFRSYPSGITATASRRQDYIRWADTRDGFIIEDDFDSELSPSSKAEDTLFSLSAAQRVIYVSTFSKTVAPSIRVGYMVLPERLIQAFHERVGFYSCSVPAAEQFVLAELISSGEYTRHINRVRRRRRQEKG